MDNIKRTQEYFDRHFERLGCIKEAEQADIIKATAVSLSHKLGGRILDIGSGSEASYSAGPEAKVIRCDISFSSLKRNKGNRNDGMVVADGRRLGFKDNCFDGALLLHTLHHLAGNSVCETDENISFCFGEAFRVLKKGGTAFIIDALCPRMMQRAEGLLYQTLFFIFRAFHKPMVYYFSLWHVTEILRQCGFKDITCQTMDTGHAKLCPFDSCVGIPFKYTPLSHVLVEAVK